MVSLNDYNEGNGNGFLGGEAEGAASLLKAMQAGQITGRDTANQSLSQEPLKVESLEKTLKVLEFRTQDIKLINALPKQNAYNTVEEYLQLQSYGTLRGGFYNEGELSDVEDSVYIRRAQQIKYLQVTGEVTLQAQMVRSYVDAFSKEIENKMMYILRLSDYSLTKGDADVVPQEFNSLYKQHQAVGTAAGSLYPTMQAYYQGGNIIDLRGKSLKQKDVENGALQVDANFGTANVLAAPTSTISTLSQDYYQAQRIIQDGRGFEGSIGTVPKAIDTTLGAVTLLTDKFMAKKVAKSAVTSSESAKAPSAPSVVSAVLVSDPGTSMFTTQDPGYGLNSFVAVASVNQYGESALTIFATPLVLAAGSSIDITITPAVSNLYAASGYVIYRSQPTTAAVATGLNFYPIFKIADSVRQSGYDGGAGGVVRDRGYFLPNTEEAFITQMDDEVAVYKQLAPISKLDLAVLSMSRRFIIFSFATPILYAPKKMVRYINVGKTYN